MTAAKVMLSDEGVVVEVEGVEDVVPRLHGQDLLDHLLAAHAPGDVPQSLESSRCSIW